MTKSVRQKIIASVTFLGGLYFFLEFMLPEKIGTFQFNKYSDQIAIGIGVISIMAVGLGIINVIMVHGGRIVRSQKGWPNSAVLVAGMIVMFIFEGINFVNAEKRLTASREFFNLAQFVERIDSDYAKSKAAPKPRVEALAKRLSEIEASLNSADSMLAPPEDAPLKIRNLVQEVRFNIQNTAQALPGLADSIMHDRPPVELPETPPVDPASQTHASAAQPPVAAKPFRPRPLSK